MLPSVLLYRIIAFSNPRAPLQSSNLSPSIPSSNIFLRRLQLSSPLNLHMPLATVSRFTNRSSRTYHYDPKSRPPQCKEMGGTSTSSASSSHWPLINDPPRPLWFLLCVTHLVYWWWRRWSRDGHHHLTHLITSVHWLSSSLLFSRLLFKLFQPTTNSQLLVLDQKRGHLKCLRVHLTTKCVTMWCGVSLSVSHSSSTFIVGWSVGESVQRHPHQRLIKNNI